MDGDFVTSNRLIGDQRQKWRDLITMIEIEGGTFNMGNQDSFDEASVQEQQY